MNRILSISVNWGFAQPNFESVDRMLDRAGGDWIRFSPCQWFFWTEMDQLVLRGQLFAAIGEQNHILISTLEPTACFGNTQPWVWEWLNNKMKLQLDGRFLGKIK